jgi:hypothetical protein
MRWAEHVARMRREMHKRFLVGKPDGKSHLEDLVVDVRITLNAA